MENYYIYAIILLKTANLRYQGLAVFSKLAGVVFYLVKLEKSGFSHLS